MGLDVRRAATIAIATLALALGLAGCGDFETRACFGPACDMDGGPDSLSPEGGAVDPDASAGSADAGAMPPPDSYEATGSARGCYDSVDNDFDGSADCDDTSCGLLASCCIGRAGCCQDVDLGLPVLDWSGCADTNPVSCAPPGVTFFGDPLPRLQSGGAWLYPGGDSTFDSGLVVDRPIDPATHRITLTARFAPAITCDGTCIDSVGLGLTMQPLDTFGTTTNARPLVAVLASAARGTMALVIAGELVTEWPHTSAADGEGDEVTLDVDPNGGIQVLHAGAPVVAESLPLPAAAQARIVVYGRSPNRSAADWLGARIGSLRAAVQVCDVPTAWSRHDAIPVAWRDGTPFGRSVRAPSLVAQDGSEALAFESDRQIFFATRPSGSTAAFAVAGNSTTPVPALSGTGTFDEFGVGDPELVPATGAWVLLYTARGTDSVRRIGRATMPYDGTTFFPAEYPVIDPSTYGLRHVDAPSVVVEADGRWLLVARTTGLDGGTSLAAFESRDEGSSWGMVASADLAANVRSAVATAFDADEVGAPGVVFRDGAYRIYYAGRQGTRYGIGLIASDELAYFRRFDEIFAGVAGQFDALGARDPDPLIVGGELWLLYTGTDGATDRIGRLVQPVAPAAP